MNYLKRSLFWVAFYLVIIFILGQLDYADRPVINLASYFYILVFIVVVCTALLPSFYRAPQSVSMIFWASVYIGLSRFIDRSKTAPDSIETIFVEIVLLELGVWLAYRFALDLAHSESLIDTMAINTFPNQAIELDNAMNLIRNEITRSRRYQRPLSLLIIRAIPENTDIYKEFLRSFKHDIVSRFSSARMAQIIGEQIRQTDTLMRDRVGRFIVLCPETSKEMVMSFGDRICTNLEDGLGLNVSWGCSSFPDDALTFDDMVVRAHAQMNSSTLKKEEISTSLE